ncbi:MAG TPA: hypothetical protein VKT71_01460 [Candidatus Acidoferrales bacterium]|nr:hypothetical protein [Candidatus Acidoferrales bacterium]
MAEHSVSGAARHGRRWTAAMAGLAMMWAFLPLAARQMDQMPVSNKAAGAAPEKPALGPPTMPIEEIVQKFAAHEAEFKIERDNFTYTQTFTIQTLDTSNRPDGEYTMGSEIVFTPAGKRYEKVTYAPMSTLERISLSQQDLDDLEHVQPFVLTTSELPKYNVKYVDHVQLDELTTYVFDVAPKTIEKNQRYFQGRIWVEDKDLEIVKTDGKAVPDIRKKGGEENVFPRFETFRENIEGHYWFPTYTRSNDVLRFSSGDVPIRMVVKYENYKRFGVTIKIGQPAKAAPDQPSK